MHNLKEIRKNFDDFKNALQGRSLKIDFNQLKTTGNWKLIPKAKISFMTNYKYSFTLASNWIGKLELDPIVSKDKKNLIANGITK